MGEKGLGEKGIEREREKERGEHSLHLLGHLTSPQRQVRKECMVGLGGAGGVGGHSAPSRLRGDGGGGRGGGSSQLPPV